MQLPSGINDGWSIPRELFGASFQNELVEIAYGLELIALHMSASRDYLTAVTGL